jgi:hypothetical protein
MLSHVNLGKSCQALFVLISAPRKLEMQWQSVFSLTIAE